MFEALSRELLKAGVCVRFEARGGSMSPSIRDGEIVHVTPVIVSKLRKGDIVLTKSDSGFRVHRLVIVECEKNVFVTRGDCGLQDDPAVRGEEILGVAEAKEVQVGRRMVRAKLRGIGGRALQCAARAEVLLSKLGKVARITWSQRRVSSKAAREAPPSLVCALGLLLLLIGSTQAAAQVLVDASTSGTALITGTGTGTVNFNHTTTATANRLLLVGVSINLTN